jgi:hypothetical protein
MYTSGAKLFQLNHENRERREENFFSACRSLHVDVLIDFYSSKTECSSLWLSQHNEAIQAFDAKLAINLLKSF